MHNPNACPLCKTTGKSLAGIVASETSTGKWSGSGGGIGIGAGGPLLFVGGASGTKQEQSRRAEAFAAPSPRASHPATGMVVSAALVLLAAGFFYGIAWPVLGDFLSSVDGGTPTAPGEMVRVDQQLSEFLPIAGTGVVLVSIFAAAMQLFGAHKAATDPGELERYRAAQERDKAREQAYYRLRYCEADHLAFDPVSGLHAPAEAVHIDALLSRISDK